MGIEVCDLRKKFQLLKAYGCIDSLKEIAIKVGRAEKTLWGWADGTATTQPNEVPQKNFEMLQKVFAETLSEFVSPHRAAELLISPASHLETELRRSQATSFLDIIRNDADTKAIRVITEKQNERGLIETQLDLVPEGQMHKIKRGQWFRLVLECDVSSYDIVALQNGAGLWGTVPCTIESETGHLHLPGIKSDGTPALMREVNAVGKNLFIVIATKAPLPSWLVHTVSDRQTLDAASLSALADVLQKQQKNMRPTYMVLIDIE